MKIFIFLFLIVGSNAKYWEAINDFQEIMKDYKNMAETSIVSIEGIINATRKESTTFVENVFKSNPIFKNITKLQSENQGMCYRKFFIKDNLNISFMLQTYQLELPLQTRIIDIKDRLSTLNSNVGIYQNLADSKFLRCQAFGNSCKKETDDWLERMMRSLSYSVKSNFLEHSITKRSVCSVGQFRCSDGGCIDSSKFCDGNCHCRQDYYSSCPDEPSGCVRNCNEFRCKETFKCIYNSSKCDGVDDCGDGSDEEGCPPPVFTNANCSIDAGDFLCGTKRCIGIELVCDGQDDCGDGSDEGEQCNENVCSPSCGIIGGVCLVSPKGPLCLYECPPGMFETTTGCRQEPESNPATLAEIIEDTPRLTNRYAVRIKYLKMKTIFEVSKALQEVVRCKKGEFTKLSKVIKFYQKSITPNSPDIDQGNSSFSSNTTTFSPTNL